MKDLTKEILNEVRAHESMSHDGAITVLAGVIAKQSQRIDHLESTVNMLVKRFGDTR